MTQSINMRMVMKHTSSFEHSAEVPVSQKAIVRSATTGLHDLHDLDPERVARHTCHDSIVK